MTDHSTEQLALFMNARDVRDYGTAEWDTLDLAGREAYLTDAAAVIAAMKALGWAETHTVTDDEREALARVIEEGWGNPTWDGVTLRPIDRQIADAVLAAGFRRSEVPEPNGYRATLIREAREHADHYRRFDDTESLVSTLVEMSNALASVPEPQGAPSDAQVEAAAKTFANRMGDGPWEDLLDTFQDDYRQDARAALRAAGGVR